MNHRIHWRNAAVATFIIVALFLAVTAPFTSPPLSAQTAITIDPPTPTISVAPGGTSQILITVTNNNIPGAVDRTFTLAFSNIPTGIQIAPSGSTFIAVGSSQQITIGAAVASTVAPGVYTIAGIITGTAAGQTNVTQSIFLQLTVTGATFTPTPTTTPTSRPATVTPTRGPVCRDGFEDDNSPATAKVIDVDTSQERAICPAGDVDWLVFGGVEGKVYTIDIASQSPGLDLSLEIFDANLNSIAFNDDFFNRTPGSPNPGDTRPRITIRIPADGRYYIRVRDVAGRGAVDFLYVIALLSGSYGPTPTLVSNVCLDLFEPDGLPEQSKLITSNELQENRALCPDGDADWVSFFGKTGKRYIMYTDTRRYVGRTRVNEDTQAGADTVMVLTDRDGVSVIDINDDIPGGNSLDSQIEFIPQVDGFYFMQIKNVGDIGNQFIRYDLVLLLCLPGQTDCGRTAITGLPINPLTPVPTGTPDREFVLDQPTATPTNTATPVP